MDRIKYYLDTYQRMYESMEASAVELQKSILFTSLPVLGVAIAFANTLTTVSKLFLLTLSGVFLVVSVIGVIFWYWCRIITSKFFQKSEDFRAYLLGKSEDFDLKTEDLAAGYVIGFVFLWILPIMCTLFYTVGILLISAFFYYNFPSP